MKQVIFILLLSAFATQVSKAQERLLFSRLDSVLSYAEQNSSSVKNARQSALIAKWERISARAGLINFRMQTNFSMTDNLELPVTYLPGEAFGGEPGSYKEVTTGQKYITNLNVMPQIDLINPVNYAKLKSANVNYELTELNNLIAKKSLYESISAAYFNIVSLREQIEITEKSLLTADSLELNFKRKYDKGIIQNQDVNDAKINRLTVTDKLNQLNKNLEVQYYNLKILCDIPENTELEINANIRDEDSPETLESDNRLTYKQALLQVEKAEADTRMSRNMQLPTVSLVFYDAWQQNSNISFFDDEANWINPKYIGLKISLPFPSVSAYTQTQTNKIKQSISSENAEHIKLQNDVENKQLTLNYKSAYAQLTTAKEIKELKEENYGFALNRFNADILSPDKLLIAFNDMLISQLNYSIAQANFRQSASIININNTIK